MAEVYFLYMERLGYPPKQARDLLRFSKSINKKLSWKQAGELVTNPPSSSIKKTNNIRFPVNDTLQITSEMMDKAQNKSKYGKSVNIDIFTQRNNKCFGKNANDTDIVIEHCSALHRLIQAVKYHFKMNIEEFTDFCVNIYTNALNDHIHFMINHSKQIEQINNILIKKPDFVRCKISKCNAMGRHYRIRRQKKPLIKHIIFMAIYLTDFITTFFIYLK
eukprot:14444_1